MNKNIEKLVKIAYDAFADKKGIDIKILKISNISTIADYFVIVTGNNPSQVRALQDNAEEQLAKNGFRPSRIEGVKNSNWVLMDYSDVILHVFSTEDREFYNLDHIWKDAEVISRDSLN